MLSGVTSIVHTQPRIDKDEHNIFESDPIFGLKIHRSLFSDYPTVLDIWDIN